MPAQGRANNFFVPPLVDLEKILAAAKTSCVWPTKLSIVPRCDVPTPSAKVPLGVHLELV